MPCGLNLMKNLWTTDRQKWSELGFKDFNNRISDENRRHNPKRRATINTLSWINYDIIGREPLPHFIGRAHEVKKDQHFYPIKTTISWNTLANESEEQNSELFQEPLAWPNTGKKLPQMSELNW